VDECKPLGGGTAEERLAALVVLHAKGLVTADEFIAAKAKVDDRLTVGRGLHSSTVHFSAQCKRFLWDRRCIRGLFMGCLGGITGY